MSGSSVVKISTFLSEWGALIRPHFLGTIDSENAGAFLIAFSSRSQRRQDAPSCARISDADMLPLMEQSAVVYRVRDKLIVGSIVRTAMGVGLDVHPISLEMTSPEGDVSAAIGQALARSGHVVPHPAQDQWKGMFKPFERAAGVRSYKAFMVDANSVVLTTRNGKLELTPHRNLGSAEGFESIPSRTIVLPADDVAGAAVALRTLLNASFR